MSGSRTMFFGKPGRFGEPPAFPSAPKSRVHIGPGATAAHTESTDWLPDSKAAT
jgi:hypothetical protein